jgi:hypothetical protein
MKLKQISVPIENSHDRLYELIWTLGQNGIGLKAFNLVDTGNYGELRILVSDVASARQILLQKDIPGRVEEVIGVEIENKDAQLSDLIASMMKADINIKYSYAIADTSPGRSTMIFAFSDNDKAVRVLSENNYPLAGIDS